MTLGNLKQMVFKINVSHKGKTLKYEVESEDLVGTKIGDKIDGKKFSPDLEGYEIEITGTSDKAGFAGFKELEGPQLRKELLTYGMGMKKKPKGESKKPLGKPKGLRLRKSVRGNEISLDTVQINSKVIKEGGQKFDVLVKPAAPAAESSGDAETTPPVKEEAQDTKKESEDKTSEQSSPKEPAVEEKPLEEKKE